MTQIMEMGNYITSDGGKLLARRLAARGTPYEHAQDQLQLNGISPTLWCRGRPFLKGHRSRRKAVGLGRFIP